MADSDTISGIENLKSAVSGETPAYQYKDPNTDMMKAISKCIDAADGTIDNQYEYKNPNTDVIRKMDELADAISEGGGRVGGRQISYLKWHITNTRSNPEGSAVQLSEFYLYLNDVLYNWNSNVSITASLPPYSANESIEHIIDGDVDTKYVTTSWGSSSVGQCDIIISLGETITVDNNTSYAYATGNDVPSRDPVGWTLFGSIDGSNWFALDTRDGVSVPIERKTSTERFIISIGGSNLDSILEAGVVSTSSDYATATFDDVSDYTQIICRLYKDGDFYYQILNVSDIPETGELNSNFMSPSSADFSISRTSVRLTYYTGGFRTIYMDIVGSKEIIFPHVYT